MGNNDGECMPTMGNNDGECMPTMGNNDGECMPTMGNNDGECIHNYHAEGKGAICFIQQRPLSLYIVNHHHISPN